MTEVQSVRNCSVFGLSKYPLELPDCIDGLIKHLIMHFVTAFNRLQPITVGSLIDDRLVGF